MPCQVIARCVSNLKIIAHWLSANTNDGAGIFICASHLIVQILLRYLSPPYSTGNLHRVNILLEDKSRCCINSGFYAANLPLPFAEPIPVPLAYLSPLAGDSFPHHVCELILYGHEAKRDSDNCSSCRGIARCYVYVFASLNGQGGFTPNRPSMERSSSTSGQWIP